MSLLEMYKRACVLSDPIASAVRAANAAKTNADALEDAALTSGAMRGEFRVMLRFSRAPGYQRLVPFLA